MISLFVLSKRSARLHTAVVKLGLIICLKLLHQLHVVVIDICN